MKATARPSERSRSSTALWSSRSSRSSQPFFFPRLRAGAALARAIYCVSNVKQGALAFSVRPGLRTSDSRWSTTTLRLYSCPPGIISLIGARREPIRTRQRPCSLSHPALREESALGYCPEIGKTNGGLPILMSLVSRISAALDQKASTGLLLTDGGKRAPHRVTDGRLPRLARPSNVRVPK